MIRIGVTGGIGSGKSTVCAIFAGLGIPVYNSDARARELMEGSGERGDGGKLKSAITALLGKEAYGGGTLDRAFIAGKVFNDRTLLASLNAIVHPAVAEDFEAWAAKMEATEATWVETAEMETGEVGAPPPFVVLESAILFESGFDRLVDKVVTVSAPEAVRLKRIVGRDGCSREAAMARMVAQMTDAEREARADHVIYNGGGIWDTAVAVEKLYKLLKQ